MKETKFMNSRKEILKNHLLSLPYVFDLTTNEIDRLTHQIDKAVLHVIEDDGAQDAIRMIYAAANWYNIPHAEGSRHLRGENDFLSIRLICALYEKDCYDKLPQYVKDSLKKFFTKEDYHSIYGSENHALMFRASRLLAAQFYRGEYFENSSMSGEDCYNADLRYIKEFILFRAKYGWGEFDSLGYAGEIILILATLHKYISDESLRDICHKMIDVILLDMIEDSMGYYYGGAHGRSYPGSIINRSASSMSCIYRYYFGTDFEENNKSASVNIYLSDYVPSEIVYRIASAPVTPRESRERKHLHLMSAWINEIRYDRLAAETGSINKYTYVCEDYAIGAVNHQEGYSQSSIASDRSYAHHQQHEWELTLPESDHKIFSHHFGIPNYHKINNRWTGDWGCCCGRFYSNRDTVIAMYNIENRSATDIINAFIPLNAFKNYILDGNYVFLEYGKLYISVYFDNGYEICRDPEDEFCGREFLSRGWQNAVVLRVKYATDFSSFEEFMSYIRSLPVIFDRSAREVRFDGIHLTRTESFEGEERNIYPYSAVYDSPIMYSEWGSGIIEIKCGNDREVYDFNG